MFGEEQLADPSTVTITGANFHLTGYMLDCTIAPCAAIAQ
jgi:hypothetical protein